MFSITYTQEFNQVRVLGYNPDNPIDKFHDVLTFEREKAAEGFCLMVQAIEAAIQSRYDGRFAIAMTGEKIDITTETTIPNDERKIITGRIQKVIDLGLFPEMNQFEIYAMDE